MLQQALAYSVARACLKSTLTRRYCVVHGCGSCDRRISVQAASVRSISAMLYKGRESCVQQGRGSMAGRPLAAARLQFQRALQFVLEFTYEDLARFLRGRGNYFRASHFKPWGQRAQQQETILPMAHMRGIVTHPYLLLQKNGPFSSLFSTHNFQSACAKPSKGK